jgi:hypothetical protein
VLAALAVTTLVSVCPQDGPKKDEDKKDAAQEKVIIVASVKEAYAFPSAVVGDKPQKTKYVPPPQQHKVATIVLYFALDDDAGFELKVAEIEAIAAGKIFSLVITPKTDLEAGTYTATVTVTGENIEPPRLRRQLQGNRYRLPRPALLPSSRG